MYFPYFSGLLYLPFPLCFLLYLPQVSEQSPTSPVKEPYIPPKRDLLTELLRSRCRRQFYRDRQFVFKVDEIVVAFRSDGSRRYGRILQGNRALYSPQKRPTHFVPTARAAMGVSSKVICVCIFVCICARAAMGVSSKVICVIYCLSELIRCLTVGHLCVSLCVSSKVICVGFFVCLCVRARLRVCARVCVCAKRASVRGATGGSAKVICVYIVYIYRLLEFVVYGMCVCICVSVYIVYWNSICVSVWWVNR